MKRILIILGLAFLIFSTNAQNVKGYKVWAIDTLQIDTAKFTATTQVDGDDDTISTKGYVDDNMFIEPINSIEFSPIAAPVYVPGLVFYDQTDDELSFYDSDINTKLNIGSERRIKVRNNSGSDIPDFTPVYQTGAVGNRATIDLAKADLESTSMVIAITTSIIGNNTNSSATSGGTINGVDTDGSPYGESWNDADEIFLSATTEGWFTKVAPTGNNMSISVGHVLTAANNGSFEVKIDGANVVGISSSTDNAFVRFDGTSGKRIKESTSIDASEISIALGGGSPTVDQLQEYINNTGSSGFFLSGALSDGGAGTLDVAAGQGFIRTTNDPNAELQSFKWGASAGIAVADNTTQYVYVDDSGVITLSTDEFLEAPDKIQIGVVTDEGGAIESTFSLGVRLAESVGQAGRFIRRVHGIERNKRMGGLIFGQSSDANRDVTMTAGQLEWGRTEYPISAFNTAGADVFQTYSASGQENAVASQWDNLQYDNAGTLTTLSNNSKWANAFFFIIPDDKIAMVYGRFEHSSEGAADEEDVPTTSLPTKISETSKLAARFTFQKSSNTATISSAFEQLFANASVTDHSNLASLAWTSSGHTGTVSTLAGFDGTGAATEYTESDYVNIDTIYTTKNISFNNDSIKYEKDGVVYNVTEIYKPNGIEQGGRVTWQSDLIFSTTACKYRINNIPYETITALDTLATADVTNPRIDILVVDTLSRVTVVTGIPAPTPLKPTPDPQSQIELTFVEIPAGATEPIPPGGGTLVDSIVYDENVEWTATASGVSVDFNSAADVYIGSVSADVGTITDGDYLKFVTGTAVSTDFENLSFFVKIKNVITKSHGFNVQFFNSSIAVSDKHEVPAVTGFYWVNYALDVTSVVFSDTEFDEIRLSYFQKGAETNTGFYFDYMKLQGGFSQPVTIPNNIALYTNDTIRETAISRLNFTGTNIGISYTSPGNIELIGGGSLWQSVTNGIAPTTISDVVYIGSTSGTGGGTYELDVVGRGIFTEELAVSSYVNSAYNIINERASIGTPGPTTGLLWMNSADDKLYWKNNTTTYDLTAGGDININVQTLTETAGAVSWDMSLGSRAKVTIDETSVITITNMLEGAEATIIIIQGDADDDNATFVLSGATVKWRGNDEDLTNTSGAYDKIKLTNMDGILITDLDKNYINQ